MQLVNDGGWRGARLPELRGEIYGKLSGLLGKISSEGDSVIGQVIAVSSEDDLQIIEAMGWLYAGFFISEGEGAQLDGAGEWFNLRRYGLTQSSARVIYLLKADGSVNAGDVFQVYGIDGDWEVAVTTTADVNQANGLVLSVIDSALVTGNTFVITVNGTEYTTQFETGDTSDSVIARLFGIVIDSDATMTTDTTAYGEMLFVADGATTAAYSFSDAVFDVVRVGMPVTAYYQSQTSFPVVDYGDVVSDDILVLANGTQGYLIEKDESYRARLQAKAAAKQQSVSASHPGIRTAVLAVEGVSYCGVNNNRGISTDSNGLPGKSIQVFVAGGEDNDVAQAIYDACAGECNTYGVNFGTATDGESTETMYFSRQAYQEIFVSLADAQWDAETTGQPDDYYTVARTVIEDYFSLLAVGRDVFAGQIYARLLTALPTLTDITVTVGTTASPTGKQVSIADGVIAVTDDAAITIEGEA